MGQLKPNLAHASNVNSSIFLGTFDAMTTNCFHSNFGKQTKGCHLQTRISRVVLIDLT